MFKPADFEQATGYNDFEVLEVGGHLMRILKVEETKSSTGKDMIKIYLDTTADDKQPNFFKNKFNNNTKENKTWGCIVYQLVLDDKGLTNKGFKSFIDAVEASNKGFQVQWRDAFCQCLTGKLVGGVFRREQFKTNDGSEELKFAVKCCGFRTIEAIKKGVPAPKDKLLQGHQASSNIVWTPSAEIEDDLLPF